jgi:hypothetical protein
MCQHVVMFCTCMYLIQTSISLYVLCVYLYTPGCITLKLSPVLQDFVEQGVIQTRGCQMSSSSMHIWTLTTSQAHLHHSSQPQLCGIRQNGSLAGSWHHAQSQEKRDPGKDRHVAGGRITACSCIMPVSPTLWEW